MTPAAERARQIEKEEFAALSPDQSQLALVGKGGGATPLDTVQVFDLRTGAAAAEFRHPHLPPHPLAVGRIAWGPNSRLLATTCSDSIYTWDVPRKKLQTVMKNMRGEWAMTFAREGNILISAGSRGLLQFSDPLTGARLLTIAAPRRERNMDFEATVERACARWVAAVDRRPGTVLAVVGAVTGLIAVYAALTLGVNSDPRNLIDRNLPFQIRQREFAKTFHTAADGILVASGSATLLFIEPAGLAKESADGR